MILLNNGNDRNQLMIIRHRGKLRYHALKPGSGITSAAPPYRIRGLQPAKQFVSPSLVTPLEIGIKNIMAQFVSQLNVISELSVIAASLFVVVRKK